MDKFKHNLRKNMGKMHRWLEENIPSYASWHRVPEHHAVHFTALIVVGVVLTASLISSISVVSAQSTAAVGFTSQQATLHELNTNLLHTVKKYNASTEEARSALGAQLSELALKRKSALRQEMKNNPSAFLSYALPPSLVRKLPNLIQPLLEQELNVTGELTVIISEDFRENSETVYELKTEDSSGVKRYRLHFTGLPPRGATTGARMSARGVALDNDIIVATADAPGGNTTGGSTGTTGSAPVFATPGQQKAVVMLINFTNNTAQTWSPAQVASVMFTAPNSVNNHYMSSTYNQVSVVGDVVGWFTIPYTNENCGNMDYQWMAAADQAAVAAGVNFGNYNRKVYLLNSSAGCSWGGRGTIGGTPGWSISYGYNRGDIIAHELAHNIGLGHAVKLNCGADQIKPSYLSSCLVGLSGYNDYGDPTDIMGAYNYFQYNAPHLVIFNTIGSQVQTISTPGTYTIAPLESSAPGTKALKISKPDTSEAYYVSYRQPLNFDAGMSALLTGGASIEVWGGSYASQKTYRLDLTPDGGNMANSSLADGMSFNDPMNGITITQLSHSTSSLLVDVQFPPPTCYPTNPTVSLNPLSKSGSDSAPLTYTLSVRNNDSSACAPTQFNLAGTVQSGWSYSSSQPSLILASGVSGSATVTVTPPAGVLDGSYGFSAKALDALNASHGASVSGTYVSFTDTDSPTVTITSPANGTVLKGNKPVTISANASDSSGIKTIVISVGSSTLKTCANTTVCSTNWSTGKLPAGTYTISVSATDNTTPGKTTTSTRTVSK